MEFFQSKAGRVIAMIIILLISIWVGWALKKLAYLLYGRISGKKNIDPGKFFLFSTLLRLFLLIVGVGFAISFVPNIKSVSTSLLASAGIVTAIVGFAAKDVLANFVSGFVIMLFRPFTITNWINVNNDHEGWVTEISILYTVIMNKTNHRMIIPNSKIISTWLINSSYHDERICQIVEFMIGYGSDIQKAKQIIAEVAEKNEHCIDNRTDTQKQKNFPIVEIRLQEFASYGIKLRALVWVSKPSEADIMIWALNEEVKERFDQEGIELPMPYQNLVFKNNLEMTDSSIPK